MEKQAKQYSTVRPEKFSPEKDKLINEICLRALLRAVSNGTFDASKLKPGSGEESKQAAI